MQSEFWLERWERGEIGFHLDDINPYLRQYWPQMQLAVGSRVLVPLCGKSLDLMWLRDQGYRVAGVELSRQAVEAFFREAGLVPQVSSSGALQRRYCWRRSAGASISRRTRTSTTAAAWISRRCSAWRRNKGWLPASTGSGRMTC